MKPTITFTDLIENRDNNMYSVELLARVSPGNQVLKAISPPVALEMADSVKCDEIFRSSLNQLGIAAHMSATKHGVNLPSLSFITLADLMSMFDIKQTVTFNNDLHKAGRSTSFILEAIW